jgi:hypothetical protein
MPPPVGSWVVLTSVWRNEQQAWAPDVHTQPMLWFSTPDLAWASAAQRPEPTWVAEVIDLEGAWSTGEPILVERQ